MQSDSHLVSQARVATLARGAPDQELVPTQGRVVEHGTCPLNESCPGHMGRGSPSSASTSEQPDPNPVAMLELQPATPLLTSVCNCGSSFDLSWPVA